MNAIPWFTICMAINIIWAVFAFVINRTWKKAYSEMNEEWCAYCNKINEKWASYYEKERKNTDDGNRREADAEGYSQDSDSFAADREVNERYGADGEERTD